MSELLSPPPGQPGLGLTQSQKDLIAGSVGGMAQVLVGQVCCTCLNPSRISSSPFILYVAESLEQKTEWPN